jgi:copper resistance protein B
MMNKQATCLIAVLLASGLSTTWAQGPAMQGGSPPEDARDPHAYSDGFDFGDIPRPRFADEHSFYLVLLDRLETARSSGNTSGFYDLQAWYGRDYDRAVLKAEGTLDSNEIEEASTELLWGHAVATYWDTQLGVRYDSGDGPDRGWLAFGVQGLAPYWFEVDATVYVGEGGRTAANLETTYDLLLTQKLILQPRIEADWYGRRDSRRGLGSGISEVKGGLRLRYEIRREFAPYLGLEWARKYGDTKDFAQSAGQEASEARLVAGLRLWF